MVIRPLSNTKWLVVVYTGAAVVLVPWIVFLWFSQPHRGTEHNVGLLAGGLVGILAVSTLAAGLLYLGSATSAIVGAAIAGSFALATVWFRFTAQPIQTSAVAECIALTILLIPLFLLLWCAHRWLRRLDCNRRVRLLLCLAYGVAALLVLGGALHVASIVPRTATEHHLRLVWTGLDLIELLGLTWTAWCLRVGSRFVVFAGAFTAAFLASDAWTNVISTTNQARIAAGGMAVIELSLASLSVWVAVQSASDIRTTSAMGKDPLR
jgi:hypothetical protein